MRARFLIPVLWCAALSSGACADAREIVLSKPVSAPIPGYPPALAATGKAGRVESIVGTNIDGTVEAVIPIDATDESLKALAIEAIRNWRFTPTLVDGKPARYYFIVPLELSNNVVRLGEIRDEDPADNMPRRLKGVPPVFPEELLKTGNQGTVWVQFVVDKHGGILAPRVVKATHPAFEQPAIDAILQWKFAPATANGKPVARRVTQPIVFDLGNRGVDSFSISRDKKGKGAKGGPAYHAPKPKATVFAVHPYEEAIADKNGTAEVKCIIAPDGKVIATQVLSASKPEFGLALAAAMEAWTFDPAQKGDDRVTVSLTRRVSFERGDRDSVIDDEVSAIARDIRRNRFKPAGPRELDAPLKPRFSAPPVYPTALLQKADNGTAVIEIIVTERGHAVLPRIVSASAPEFGWAAATAAQRWLFEPPKVRGKGVAVKVQIPFEFTVPEPVKSAAPGTN